MGMYTVDKSVSILRNAMRHSNFKQAQCIKHMFALIQIENNQ